MTEPMPDAAFWTSTPCHIAIDPRRPDDATSLAEWATSQGMKKLCFFQTSGSEGFPKWVALPKQAFLLSATAVNQHLNSDASDCWLIALPQHHVGGFAIMARAYLSGARVLHYTQAWDPLIFQQNCTERAVTLVSLVPTQVHDLVRARLPCPRSLRAAIIGGGSLSPELISAARELGWPILQSYGMTEAASQIATQALDQPDLPMLILAHWQARTDEQKRLILSGPALASGYALKQPNGWQWQSIGSELITRDLVELQELDGRRWLTFVGREAGYVKILGELIHLAPLQTRLDRLALSLDMPSTLVLVPMPDARRDNVIVLAAEPHPALETLTRLYQEMTAPLCQIQRTYILPKIPRTALAKVDTPALMQHLLSER